MGFKKGKPVAACIIYKCLLHWGVFEAERTTIFDFIIHTINSILKVRPCSIWITMWLRCSGYWFQHFAFQTENENDILPYWLANTSALLCMLQRNLRSKGFIMAPSRSSSDTHLSEKANEVSSIPFNLFTFQLEFCGSLLYMLFGFKDQFISGNQLVTSSNKLHWY